VRLEAEPGDLPLYLSEVCGLEVVRPADDDAMSVRVRSAQQRHCFDEDVNSLPPLEPGDDADERPLGGQSEPSSQLRGRRQPCDVKAIELRARIDHPLPANRANGGLRP
jgi:hypothetical protein